MRTEHDGDGVTWHYIQCGGCHVRTLGHWHSQGNDCPEHRAEVREDWNRRVSPAPAAAPEAPTADDYEAVLADHRRLVRELDVLLNGEGAAQQASLCDIVAQLQRAKALPEQPTGDEWLKEHERLANKLAGAAFSHGIAYRSREDDSYNEAMDAEVESKAAARAAASATLLAHARLRAAAGGEAVAYLYRDEWGTLKLAQTMPPPNGSFAVYTHPTAQEAK
jgi:hypothetical protein